MDKKKKTETNAEAEAIRTYVASVRADHPHAIKSADSARSQAQLLKSSYGLLYRLRESAARRALSSLGQPPLSKEVDDHAAAMNDVFEALKKSKESAP